MGRTRYNRLNPKKARPISANPNSVRGKLARLTLRNDQVNQSKLCKYGGLRYNSTFKWKKNSYTTQGASFIEGKRLKIV